ncbi:MAG: glutathionylspermidine synthase family protein [Thermicanus sp.]|nr:glutathionylspermidine synthase family protein [Thermicanus sp.]
MTRMERKEKRENFYHQIPRYWPDLYGQEYSLYDIREIAVEEVEEIREASRKIGRIFFKMGRLLRRVPDETLSGMGYPEKLYPYLRENFLSIDSVIARLDLVKAGGDFKCLELNADTPTFIKETHLVNGLVCKEFGLLDPNREEEGRVRSAVIQAILEAMRRVKEPYVVFTAHEDSIEDRETTRYLQELIPFPSRFIPLHRLEILRGIGLFDPEWRKIDLLYRQTYPLEQLISDRGEKGEEIGRWLMDLVMERKLALINPPSAFLLQNKAVLAAIWGLHEEKNPFFTEEEHEWIKRHFLPTYLEPDHFLREKKAYVKKPAFGREGDTVEMYDGEGVLIGEDPQKNYREYLPVYQEYVSLPKVHFHTIEGKKEGYLLTGCFLIQGEPGAIGFRVGNRITDNLSYFLPVGFASKR